MTSRKIITDLDLSGNLITNFKFNKDDINNNSSAFENLLSDRFFYEKFTSDSNAVLDESLLSKPNSIIVGYSVISSDGEILNLVNISGTLYTGRFSQHNLVAIGGGDVLKLDKRANCSVYVFYLNIS